MREDLNNLIKQEVSIDIEEIKNLFGEVAENILLVSAKTGEGVENLLEEIVKKIPSPDLDVGRPSGRPTSRS